MTDYISREAASLVLAEYGEKSVFAYTDLIRAMAKIPIADVVDKSLYNTAMENVYRFSSELKVCRNELCLQCGNYKESHKGACDGCRWKDGETWDS